MNFNCPQMLLLYCKWKNSRKCFFQIRLVDIVDRALPKNKKHQIEKMEGNEDDNITTHLQHILDVLKHMDSRSTDGEERDADRKEWIFLAAILDRFCFVFFGVVNLIVLISMFIQIPNESEALKLIE